MRIVFMGTPNFAVTILASLFANKKYEIVGVVTQPDRPQGRGNKLQASAVKEYALKCNLPIFQPLKVKDADFITILKKLNSDVIVVAAYGQILSEEILTLSKYGCINVHGSLLPKYRGAAPVQYAILNGETESGVTIMQMDKGMDTGAILKKVVVPISSNMTSGEFLNLIADVGARVLQDVLVKIESNEIQAEPQDEKEATYAHLLTRKMEIIDWKKTAAEIHNKIRAFNPVPGAYTILPNGKKLKIWKSVVAQGTGKAGEIIKIDKQGFVIACGTGALQVLELQPEGKKPMPVKDFLNGKSINLYDILGLEKGN